ncbi:MAG: hypothetical protein U9N59_14280 [Campylobacterota bacterium]|nr:hypothetical protein [Campylobacterota bacterium]
MKLKNLISIVRSIKKQIFLYKIQKKNITILWFPKIENKDDIMRELSRASWYLNPIVSYIDNITFVIGKKLNFTEFQVPNYIDNNIASIYDQIKDKFNFISNNNSKRYDVVIEWSFSNQKVKKKPLIFIRSDIKYHQFDSTKLIKFTELFLTKKEKKYNNNKLNKSLNEFKNHNFDSILLLGSGPSIDFIHNKNIKNKLTIVCNSVVKNKTVLENNTPNIIVATDSVFHAGYSKYASDFRKELCLRLQEYPTTLFFVPLRDLLIYKHNLPKDFTNRIIGIKSVKQKKFNLNLLKSNFVKSTSNVLTFFLLPIAATISKKIYLIGFDGKKKDESNTFWSYSEKSQFVDTINTVRTAHPAFYKVDYQKYSKVHKIEVDEIINKLHKENYNIINLASSNIESLNRLYETKNG